ncbi:MAG: hypothetical protein IT423_19750, partial [Pirellulaceae bacterium]|nr:hypothetical protein [Pirellulaceae bacterium]
MTLLEKVRLLGSHSPPLVSTLREDCPAQLVSLIEQLLSRDPNKRPASAAHVAEALLPFCAGHYVVELLATCRQRATAEPIVENVPVLVPHVGIAPPAKPPRRTWLALAWLSPIAILAGILITLETQKGQLVIESDVAGVKVNVLHDGKVYEQVQVQTGTQSTRLLADKYSIEIEGASDGVAIDLSTIEIRRGATVVARVTKKTKAEMTSATELHPQPQPKATDVEQESMIFDPLVSITPLGLAGDKPSRSLKSVRSLNDTITLPTHRIGNQMLLGTALALISHESGMTIRLDYEYLNRDDMNLRQPVVLRDSGPVREVLNALLSPCKLDYYMRGNTICIVSAASIAKGIDPEKLLLTPRSLYSNPVSPLAEDAQDADQSTKNIAKEPIYAGQTLTQWLDVLERDLELKTRLSTLPAIQQLSKAAGAETRQRINQVLISVIGSQVKQVRFGSEFREFMTTFMDVNGSATFATLKDSGLLEDKPVTSNTLYLLQALSKYGDPSELAPLATRWLLDEGRFQALDEQLAWQAKTFLGDNLAWQDAEFWRAFPKLIQEHPKLGLPALLTLEVPEVLAARPEAIELEEQIARAARDAFLSNDSSPQVLALAATRLASTTNVVESFRAELVGKLNERLKTLAADSERLLAVVPDNLSQ